MWSLPIFLFTFPVYHASSNNPTTTMFCLTMIPEPQSQGTPKMMKSNKMSIFQVPVLRTKAIHKENGCQENGSTIVTLWFLNLQSWLERGICRCVELHSREVLGCCKPDLVREPSMSSKGKNPSRHPDSVDCTQRFHARVGNCARGHLYYILPRNIQPGKYFACAFVFLVCLVWFLHFSQALTMCLWFETHYTDQAGLQLAEDPSALPLEC